MYKYLIASHYAYSVCFFTH